MKFAVWVFHSALYGEWHYPLKIQTLQNGKQCIVHYFCDEELFWTQQMSAGNIFWKWLLTKKPIQKSFESLGRSEGAVVHLGEHTWMIWRALYLKAHKESDNGIGLWGLSPVRQAVTAAAAVVVIPTVPRWPLKRKNGSPLWVEIWSWAYSLSLFLFLCERRPGICLHGYGAKCSAPWLGFCTVPPSISFPLTGLAGLQC